MPFAKKSFVALSINGRNVGSIESCPEPLASQRKRDLNIGNHRRSDMPMTTTSFVALSKSGEHIGSIETKSPLSSSEALRSRNESDESKSHGRSFSWGTLSSKLFRSRREKSKELTEQLRQQEEESSSNHSSIGHISGGYQHSEGNLSQRSSVPSREFHRHNQQQSDRPSSTRSQQWHESLSSLHSSQRSRSARNHDNENEVSEELTTDCSIPPKPSRFQEFMAELKSLIKDLIEYSKAKTWKKKLLTVVFFVLSILVFYDLFFGKQEYIVSWLHAFIVWMTIHHTAAVFAFVGIFVLSTLAFVPPTLLVFGAGYAFTVAMENVLAGVTAAVISSFMGSCIGAIIAFVRSRYMMRDLVKLFANRYPLIRAVDQALKAKHGFRIMLLLRLCPIIPFNGLNYCCGITGVSLHEFTLSLVGILPFQIYTVMLGATAGAVELQNLQNDEYTKTEKAVFVSFTVTGVLFGLLGILYGYRMVKQSLKEELNLTSEEFELMIRPIDAVGTDGESLSSYHLQNGDEDLRGTTKRSNSNNTSLSEITFQEEGEEWFWVWI